MSANSIETRKIKAIPGHKRDTIIESCCERPTLNQFKRMPSTRTSFINGKESLETSLSVPSTFTTTVPTVHSSSNQRLPLGRHEENVFSLLNIKFVSLRPEKGKVRYRCSLGDADVVSARHTEDNPHRNTFHLPPELTQCPLTILMHLSLETSLT